MNPEQIKTVVDLVFKELEALTASRPILSFAVAALHQFIDGALLSRVAAKAASK